MVRVTSFIIAVLCAFQVYAIGSVRNAKIETIRVDNDGRAMVFFDQEIAGTPPPCVHEAYKRALGFDASSEGGKAVLSMALTAKTTGSSVTAHGLGICGTYGGSVIETWNHGFIF